MKKQIKQLHPYFFLFLIWTLLSISCQSGGSTLENQISDDILAKDAHQLIQQNMTNDNFVVLDTRTLGEYNRGHLQNSLFIDYSSPSFKAEIEKLDKNKTYVIYCHSGGRSKTTLNLMKKLGFKEAYNMIGGIIAWTNAGYPLEK